MPRQRTGAAQSNDYLKVREQRKCVYERKAGRAIHQKWVNICKDFRVVPGTVIPDKLMMKIHPFKQIFTIVLSTGNIAYILIPGRKKHKYTISCRW